MNNMKLCFVAVLGMALAGCAGTAQQNDGEKEIYCDNVKMVARVTGESLPTDSMPNPNNTGPDYDVYGTDLGIMWQLEGNRVGMFFGDTNGKGFVINKNGGNGENWRSNVLAFTTDTNLEDGLTIDEMLVDEDGKAREVCAGGKANPAV